MSGRSCYRCWAAKHGCGPIRPDECCRGCRSSETLSNVPRRPILLSAYAIKAQFKMDTWPTALPEPGSSTKLDLDFRRSPSGTLPRTITFQGQFTYKNPRIVEELDKIVQLDFFTKLTASDGVSPIISTALCACGYLDLLSSTTDISEQVRTTLDDTSVNGPHPPHHLGLRFRYILVRLFELSARKVMESISLDHSRIQDLHQYTATAILHFKIKQFRSEPRLRTGVITVPALIGLEGPFLDWLTFIERDLRQLLHQDCRPEWGSALRGSRRSFQLKPGTLTIAMHLQQGWVSTPSARTVESLVPELPRHSENLSPSPMTYSTSQASIDTNNSGQEYFGPRQNLAVFVSPQTPTQATGLAPLQYGALLGAGPGPPSNISQFPDYTSLYSAPGDIGSQASPNPHNSFQQGIPASNVPCPPSFGHPLANIAPFHDPFISNYGDFNPGDGMDGNFLDPYVFPFDLNP